MTASSRPPTSPLQTRPTTDRFPRPADARLTAEQIAWLDDNVVYIIKAGGEADVRASIGTAICSAGKAGNERLSKAFEERKQGSRVLLLFSVGGSGKFCGLAEMVGPWKRQAVSSIWSATQPSGHFAVHWIMLKDASFAAFSHLLDPDDEMQPATYMRDSCRIHPAVARKTVMVYLQHPRGPNLIDRAPNWFRDNNRFAHLRGDAGAGPSGPPETPKRPFDPTPGGHRGRTRAGASAAGHRRVAPGPSIASYHDSGRPVSAAEQSRRRPEEPDNAQAWTNQQHNQAPRSNERGNWAAAKKPENTE
ncbi:MAG: YTH domain-containing protein 2 [Lichina confinis]|nr:MAG: YTH domain-containing protein 2 [Lichina confinis]